MLTLSVHHPQILDFVQVKRNRKRITGANISIRLSDEFMRAVEADEKYQVRFPVDADRPIVSRWISAREIWDEIVESAHGYAEPGLLFWDNILQNSPADIYSDLGFGTVSTNPCGEIVLCSYDSCRLMIVNLFLFVKHPFTDQAEFDFDLYGRVVQKAQRLMDDLIELELEQIDKIIAKIRSDPEPEMVKFTEISLWQKIREKATQGRRTGLGVTAVGDTLAALGIRYGSDRSIQVTEKLYKHLALNAYRSSCLLAKERGAFPIHDHSKEEGHPFLERIWAEDEQIREMAQKYGRRNIALLTTAPAGSVSTQTQTTSGIEPATYIQYTRRKKIVQGEDARVDFVDQSGDKWTEFDVFHHGFLQWAEVNGKSLEDVEESPYWGATIDDVDWVAKVRMQSVAQKWICHSISNTTNLPADATKETVADIYMSLD